jgi:uncharacterized Zn ribbon protein
MRVKFLSVSEHYCYEDDYRYSLNDNIGDWLEITKKQYNTFMTYRHEITNDLIKKGILNNNDSLLIIQDLNTPGISQTILDSIDIAEESAKKAELDRKAKQQKIKAASEKKREAAKAAKELKLLNELRIKYGQ